MVWSGSSRWYDAATGLTVDTDEWTHLAFSVEEGTVRVYVDGEEKFSDGLSGYLHNLKRKLQFGCELVGSALSGADR